DRTREVVREIQQKYPAITLMEFDHPLGKGGAVIEGFKKAQGDLIGFVDADGAIVPDEFAKLIIQAQKNTIDAAISSRYVSGAQVVKLQPLSRRIVSRMFNAYVRTLFGLNYTDTQCGAKVFSKASIKKILPELKATNYAFDVEILWRLRKNGFHIVETPIVWHDKFGTHVNMMSAGMDSVFTLLKLRLGML
ncbi:glycosyltransferase, partial [candidate division WWE3 bacterium]|nr:glycosyltransferase [candidate division WWE3 bacterium]